MAKFLFAILLILTVYAYFTVSSSSRAEINHSIVMIPNHISQVWGTAQEKINYFRDYSDKTY
jgi:hypothetical protein